MNPVVLFCSIFALAVYHVWSMQVIPERANVVRSNEKYIENVTLNVKRYARRGNYYINLAATTKVTFNNNVSLHFYFYEWLHNEYKRSFVEMHFKFCDMINHDPYVGKALIAVGMRCPLEAGQHKMHNITIPTDNFPNVIPFEKSRVDVKVIQTQTEELITILQIYAQFKQKNWH